MEVLTILEQHGAYSIENHSQFLWQKMQPIQSRGITSNTLTTSADIKMKPTPTTPIPP
jgi:hypothetical protein